MPVNFKPVVKLPISFHKKPGGKLILEEDIENFWVANSNYRKGKGIFVFSIKAAGYFLPVYVGKTTVSFENEIFQKHKLQKYNEALADYKNDWPPYVFLVIHPNQKGGVNKRAIDKLESFLIRVAKIRNIDLKNKIKLGDEELFTIKGVYKGKKGKTTEDEQDMKKMMGFR